jgi:phosphoserine phosphatase
MKAHVLSQVWFNRWLLEGELRSFKGAPLSALQGAAEWIVDQVMWPGRFVDVLAELHAYQQDNHRVLIASGTFQPIVEAFAQRIGAEALGSGVEVDANGCITGKLLGDPNVRRVKLARVQDVLNGSPLLAAYSNGEGDQAILKLAAEPVIVYPAIGIRLIARKHGWRILETQKRAPDWMRPDQLMH